MPARIGGAVVWRPCEPFSMLTPCASAQHSGEIAGLVPLGARFPPIVLHGSEFETSGTGAIPCRIVAAFCSCAGVGGVSGNSCPISFLTSGVNGASDAVGGELPGAGRLVDTEYGTGSAIATQGATSASVTPVSTSAARRSLLMLSPPPPTQWLDTGL